MLLQDKNKKNTIDTFLYYPIIPENIDDAHLTKDQTINHWKINNSLKYVDNNNKEKNIAIYNDNGVNKTPEEIYEMLSSWEEETIFNAFFNGDFEAGNIKGGGEDIEKLVVKRLSPASNYKIFETIGEIPYSKEYTRFLFKDYLVSSGQVYLYSIQPVTKKNHYGALQNRLAALNRYEYSWIIDTNGAQVQILNSQISNISVNTKDGVIETIGGKMPFVNRFSNLNYKTFVLTGTIASVFDTGKHIIPEVDKTVYSAQTDIQQIIDSKFIEKTGETPDKINNSMRIDYNYERIFRDQVVDILKNGHKKLFKSPTEGLMIVKLTGITLTPKPHINRMIYDFSATVTEVGEFDINMIDDFDLKGVVTIE